MEGTRTSSILDSIQTVIIVLLSVARTTALIMPYVISLPMPPTARRFSLTASSRSGSVSGLAPFPTPPAFPAYR